MDVVVKDSFSLLDTNESLLYKFRCDKFLFKNEVDGNTLNVENKIAKGILFFVKTKNNQTHFRWMNSETNTVVDDYVLFPNNIIFKKIANSSDSHIVMFELIGENKKIYYWIYDSDESKSDEIFKKVEEIVRSCNDIKANLSGVTSSNDETLSDCNKYKSKKLQRQVKDEISQLLNSMENKLIGCKKSASECIEKNDKFLDSIELLRKSLPGTNDFEQPIELFDLEPLEKLLKKGLTHYFHLREISKDKILKNKSEEEVESSLSCLPSRNIAKTVDLENHGEQIQNQSGNLKENINKKDTENNYLGFDKKSSTEFTKIESSNKNEIN